MNEERFGDFENDVLYDSESEPQSMDVMSDMVQSMAAQIYAEFERLIATYGDGVVEGLMPQLVGILENWNKAIKERQEIQLELDVTKEDNDQLLAEYEKEKQLRKAADQRNMEMEDIFEDQQKELQAKLEDALTKTKVYEVKTKNYQDQVSRLEDKEAQVKSDYEKLHSRYTELFKSHMEVMERTKAMMSAEKSETETSDRPKSLNKTGSNFVAPPTPEAENPPAIGGGDTAVLASVEGPNSQSTTDNTNLSLRSEISNDNTDRNLALSMEAAAFDELDPESMDNITGSMVNPGEFATDDSDTESLTSASSTANSVSQYGMTKEVENLIKENQELIQTKNALNVVKDDLISQVDDLTGSLELLKSELHNAKTQKEAMQEKLSNLEEEVKKLTSQQQEAERKASEEDIPREQRKRFTRVEMARVLMERNQYKERLMELQEAVRWTEMIRASKENPDKKKSSGLWNLFSNLFSSGNKSSKKLPNPSLHYSAPATHLQPVGDPNRPRRMKELGGDKSKAFEFLQEDALTEQGRRQKQAERRDNYRQVQAYVPKDDGRVQAYGWSVPTRAGDQSSLLSVPVPVYCRPLMSADDEQTNLWCAAAVYRSAGRTRDGGSIVGAHSTFYSDSLDDVGGSGDLDADTLLSKSPQLSELNQQIKEHERALSASVDYSNLTSLVWLCTTTGNNSKVQVINACNPAEVLESFEIPDAHILTIASIPGVSQRDYPTYSDTHDIIADKSHVAEGDAESEKITIRYIESSSSGSSLTNSNTERYESLAEKLSSQSDSDKADTSSIHSVDDSKRKLILPTMWLGLQNGILMIHSSLDDWKSPLKCVYLGDCILCTVHVGAKVFVGLANGTIAVFHRDSDGAWCFEDYHVIDIGTEKVPIRAMCNVANSYLWIGHTNKVYTVHVADMIVKRAFEAHERKESQVRLLTWCGDGVWIALRNDPTLRLYHAFTLEHLQDINIEPCIEKLTSGMSRPELAIVTSLDLSCRRLWIGTGNGIIISVPLTLENQQETSKAVDIPGKDKPPGGAVRVYNDVSADRVTPASYVPYCDLSLAQLSYHGHRDRVRFFATIAGNSKETSLVMSGGEGYVDFRVGNDEPQLDEKSAAFWSHLIVWEVSNNPGSSSS